MFAVLLVIHVLICVALIVVVLMQSAKGEGLAGAFGGGGGLSGAVFGGRGAASFLSKATTVLAIFFMVSCMGLSLLSAGRSTQTAAVTASGVTEAAQEDMAAQQQAQQEQAAQQAAQQQGQQQGESALPEDIFNVKPSSQGQQQQQQQTQPKQAQPQKPDSQ